MLPRIEVEFGDGPVGGLEGADFACATLSDTEETLLAAVRVELFDGAPPAARRRWEALIRQLYLSSCARSAKPARKPRKKKEPAGASLGA